ncbi:hypothetical protein TanjilG_13709 [Lupinus angustifolius]|uniref:TIR domain-containing protein n=1 Tax=Lupinus angustifolius TaxID=3871 RepID=A0A1J7HT03_LUPAN|nr:hypothetical protein TanjilG_13709 [Lupinus angustifolius]
MTLNTNTPSSSSSSIQATQWANHVFLSFRGDDTRKGFTDHLFYSLERRGIKTFKDDHDLEKGTVISLELIKAIEESMFALIIFSPNYASSTWCLDEVQKIVECSKSFGQTVFPIFHGIEPSHVRHQKGTFAECFKKHEKRFKNERGKVEKWRNALREVASHSGWDSKDQHQAALVEAIVDHIHKKVIPRLPSCTDNLVGIDYRMKKVNSLIGMGLNDVRFIGIWGMGGIGKTSIARLVYEAIKEQFKFSCFVENIREGTDAIQGIVLNLVEPYQACWSTEAFSKISQLRLLKLCKMQLPLGLNCLPSALKFLHWSGCPLETLPLTNQLDEVVDLKLPYSEIVQLWHGTKFLAKLKSIDLSFSMNLKRTPDFSEVPNLEFLVLEGCKSLTEVHPTLVFLKKIVLLNLKDCKMLKALPSKLDMSSLKDLDLSGCSQFKVVPEFGESMQHLSMLSLEGTAIIKLPLSLGNLVDLTYLELQNCKNLVCLPDTVHKLKSLIILNVSGCSKLGSLPEGLKEIKSLEELCASGTAIGELPSSVFHLENLRVMSFAGCKGPVSKSVNMFFPFKRLFGTQTHAPIGFGLPPSISCLTSLTTLTLSFCNLTEELMPDDFCRLSSLTTLDLTGNNFVSPPSCVSKLSKLKFLYLNCCKNLQWLPELPSNIRALEASNCDSLEVSKFNPSRPCSLFGSRVEGLERSEGLIPSEELIKLMSLFQAITQELHLPEAIFDMIITGSKIPSWFVPQKCVSFAEISVPHNCSPSEWVGFALCFLLVSYAYPPEECRHEIQLYLFSPNGKKIITTKLLPLMEPGYPHLYILYLSIDEYRNKINEGGEYSDIEFVLKSYCCNSLQIVRCGCRLVCKQDVEDIGNHV